MNNRCLIVGQHPIKEDIELLLRRANVEIDVYCLYEEVVYDACVWEQIFILTSPNVNDKIEEDRKAISLLNRLATLPVSVKKRPIVHLLLQCPVSLRILQTQDLPETVSEAFEVYPFTMEDVWAKNVLVQMPGIKENSYPALDGEGICCDGKNKVHVVISGFGSQAEALAVHAALVAHYPNYHPKDERPIRTRITIVGDSIMDKCNSFIAKYRHLFDNSYYRIVDVVNKKVDFHYPMYHCKRSEFVDVEWEFVNKGICFPEVSRKINDWIDSGTRQLSFFISHDDDQVNLEECMSLPAKIYEHEIPVYVKLHTKGVAEMLGSSMQYRIYPFGMVDCGYNIQQPLVRLAKLLKYFYNCSYGDVGVPTELPSDKVDEAWLEEKSLKKRFSNIYNVMTISSKMRSLGHDIGDFDTFYALTQDEIETLSETEHNRWCVERLIQGMRPCTDEELNVIKEDIKSRKNEYKNRNIHYDLRAYDELEEDETGKNVKVYDYDLTACIPLMAKTFYEEIRHG